MSDLSLSARPLLARPSRALSLALLVFVAGLIYIDQTVSIAAGGPVGRRHAARCRALPCLVRLHLRLAGLHRGPPRCRPARADGDARTRCGAVLPGAGLRHAVRPSGHGLRVPGRHLGHRRLVHLRDRHAARRRLRIGHALRRGRRQHADDRDAGLLRDRLADRHGATALVGRTAGLQAVSR